MKFINCQNCENKFKYNENYPNENKCFKCKMMKCITCCKWFKKNVEYPSDNCFNCVMKKCSCGKFFKINNDFITDKCYNCNTNKETLKNKKVSEFLDIESGEMSNPLPAGLEKFNGYKIPFRKPVKSNNPLPF